MTITLYLEQHGVIIDQKKCGYAVRRKIAKAWYRMHPGKNVTVFYIVESSLNYEKDIDDTPTHPLLSPGSGENRNCHF